MNQNANEDVSPSPGSCSYAIEVNDTRVTRSDIRRKWSAIILRTYGILNNLYLIGKYLLGGEWDYLAWTTAFVFVSSFTNGIISMLKYNQDEERMDNALYNKFRSSKYHWPIVLVLQLAPLLCSWETLQYAQKSYNYGMQGDRSKEDKYYGIMLKKDKDIAHYSLTEGVVEAVKMLANMWKLYHEPYSFKFAVVWLVFNIGLALGNLGWRVTKFNHIMRLAQPDRTIITERGLVFQNVWETLIIVSRISSVFVVASVSPTCACVWFFIHCLFMTIWIVLDRGYVAPTLKERIKLLMLDSVRGAYCFLTYVDVSDRPTLSRRTFYHALCFIQNVVACCCWAYFATDETIARCDFKFFIALCIVPYALGVLLMIVYYKLESIMKKPNHKISSNTSEETV